MGRLECSFSCPLSVVRCPLLRPPQSGVLLATDCWPLGPLTRPSATLSPWWRGKEDDPPPPIWLTKSARSESRLPGYFEAARTSQLKRRLGRLFHSAPEPPFGGQDGDDQGRQSQVWLVFARLEYDRSRAPECGRARLRPSRDIAVLRPSRIDRPIERCVFAPNCVDGRVERLDSGPGTWALRPIGLATTWNQVGPRLQFRRPTLSGCVRRRWRRASARRSSTCCRSPPARGSRSGSPAARARRPTTSRVPQRARP